jgi:folate-binding protein YgfZ
MESVHLEDRAVIALTGAEARGLLQGLITNDIEKVAPGTGIYAALLTPQGKVVSDFLIAEGDGALLLDCPAAAAEMLLKKLKLYRLRAKVEIEARPGLAVFAGLTELPGRAALRAITFADPRLAALGPRSIGALAEMPDFLPGAAAYHDARLALGVPEGADFGSDRIFALDAGLDELHGVAFDKGCYVGQELTARMKHRGTARKRLLTVEADDALPPPGSEIRDDSGVLGEITSSYGAKGFALIRLDRLEQVQGALKADTIAVRLTRPAWLG